MSPDAPTPDPPDLSIIVPVFNEVGNLRPLVREIRITLAGQPWRWELLLVNDGSSDGSLLVMGRLAALDGRIRVLHQEVNQGQSAALAVGFRHARAPILATLDGDLQNDPADLPRLLERLSEGWDVVSGVRRERHDSRARRLASRIANGVRNRVTRESVTDVGCTLRVYRRRALERLFPFDGMHRFLPTLLRMAGARITEMPVTHRPRLHGEAKYTIGGRLWQGLADLLAVRWMQARWIDPEQARELGAEDLTTVPSPAEQESPWKPRFSGSGSASPARVSSVPASSSNGSPRSGVAVASFPKPSGFSV